MARFILDVANLMPEEIKRVCDAVINADMVHKRVSTVVCIDESNEGQFYDVNSIKGNRITKEQIKSFKENYPI